MSYGELKLPPERRSHNPLNGQFLKGHTPANKGKKWDDFMGKRAQKRAAKGWKNLEIHRPKRRPDTAGRCRKRVIAVFDDGRWLMFPYLGAAAKWCGGSRENVGRCCRINQSRLPLKKCHGLPRGSINTDHRYLGVRWYFENDNIWTDKISINR